MSETVKLRRKISPEQACEILECCETQLRKLENKGVIRRRHEVWPGSRRKAFWEDEFQEDLLKLEEKVNTKRLLDEEQRRKEIASGERRYGACRPRSVTSASKPAPRTNTALLKRPVRK